MKKSVSVLSKIETPYLLIKYESLLKIDGQKKIFKFLDISFDREEPVKLENINSSFSNPEQMWKKASKNVGDTTTRYNKAPKWLKFIIRKKLEKLVITLGYPLK